MEELGWVGIGIWLLTLTVGAVGPIITGSMEYKIDFTNAHTIGGLFLGLMTCSMICAVSYIALKVTKAHKVAKAYEEKKKKETAKETVKDD